MSSSGRARTDGLPLRRALIWTAATIGVVTVLLAAAFFGYGKFVAQPQAGDVPSGVPCDELPSMAEVEQVLERQADLVGRLEALDDGVMLFPSSCGEAPDGGTEIMILVPSKAVSDAVQDILRTEPFTVPWTIRNV